MDFESTVFGNMQLSSPLGQDKSRVEYGKEKMEEEEEEWSATSTADRRFVCFRSRFSEFVQN
jgi:hypothetical protein